MDFEDLLEEGQDGEDGGFGGNADLFMFGLGDKEVQDMKQNKDSVIFLVDCHRSMHERNPHNGEGHPSNVNQVLKACISFMKTKVITSDNDKIGIVLFGSKQTKNSLNFGNIFVL